MVNALQLLKKKWFTDGECTKVFDKKKSGLLMVNAQQLLKKSGLLDVNALKLLIKSGLLMVNAQQ